MAIPEIASESMHAWSLGQTDVREFPLEQALDWLRRPAAQAAGSARLPPVVQAGHRALRLSAAPVRRVQSTVMAKTPQQVYADITPTDLDALIQVMLAVMHEAPGVGVAAPQIGLPLQIAVIGDPAPGDAKLLRALHRSPVVDHAVINPRYQAVGTERVVHWEGCLSVAGWMALVPRAFAIDAAWTDPTGAERTQRLEGWPARIFQHETDHLHGILCHDLSLPRSLCTAQAVGGFASAADFADAMGVRLQPGQRWAVGRDDVANADTHAPCD